MFTRERLLHRARSLRRLHHSTDDSDLPPVPALPSSYSAVAVSMPMPPTQRPTTAVPSSPTASTASDYCRFHRRDVSSCSHVSRASSSWSSASSTRSDSSRASSTSSRLEWDPLRLHPSTMAVDCEPRFFDCEPSHGFDFGFDKSCYTTSALPMDASDFPTGLSPPPTHHRLRGPRSETALHRPTTPVHSAHSAALPHSEPSSPVRPRMQPDAGTEVDRFLKRGDWKRRGIVFSAADLA